MRVAGSNLMQPMWSHPSHITYGPWRLTGDPSLSRSVRLALRSTTFVPSRIEALVRRDGASQRTFTGMDTT